MISLLHIENVAVIKSVDIDFQNGFSVLTGETGAGKSVIIDSLCMICGGKVSRDIIRTGEKSAVAEAVFSNLSEHVMSALDENGIEAPDGEVIIRTSLTSEGKFSARINGRSVTRTALKQIGSSLISIHGQNDSQFIYSKSACIEMIDAFADSFDVLDEYKKIYQTIEELRRNIKRISSDESQKARERDMLEYQIKDIESKKIKPGEEEILRNELLRLSNIEKINKQANFAYKVLKGAGRGTAQDLLSRAAQALSQISDAVPSASALSEKLIELSYDVEDIASKAITFADESDEDPTKRIDKIESRLDSISALKKRYGQDENAILDFCEKAKARLSEIELSESILKEYSDKLKTEEKKAKTVALTLTEKRKEAAKTASGKIQDVLSFLDMPGVRFDIAVNDTKELTPLGCDSVEFVIATNPGEPMKPMNDIASGGELSRIILSLKCVLNEKNGADCSVYDEIDTGISGKTSRKIGIKLQEISKCGQVICITHSAQIATLSDNHYLITKNEEDGRAVSNIQLLSYEGRVEEAARILGGINITDAQRVAAKEMLEGKD